MSLKYMLTINLFIKIGLTEIKVLVMTKRWLILAGLWAVYFSVTQNCLVFSQKNNFNDLILWKSEINIPQFDPRSYVCYKVSSPIVVDGKLNEEAWQLVPWTEPFMDIRGGNFPAPPFETKVKILWDNNFLYIAAQLEEPHVHAYITQRDAVIYQDNDFEVFIDPDGDTHLYYELEINALNTIWDLLLVKPYRDGGPAINGFDTKGLKTAVFIDGTLNNPSDIDVGWYVEIAIPFNALAEINNNRKPKVGDQWRINFSRVQWHTEVIHGKYVKVKDKITGKKLSEENWVWSPQGVVNMHRPETWGFVQFADSYVGNAEVEFDNKLVEKVKWVLRNIYFAQKRYYSKFGEYAEEMKQLSTIGFIPQNIPFPFEIRKGWGSYVVKIETIHGIWFINNIGKIWSDG
ncbi:Carbohydrate family 9 binding domain-like [Thermophagus xiamenensis]|uniref:Carbohydrate family 9 binding domain-like n=2 Tax=Thermophagus xiamenensis TaxID=385682 RepID=A0A1I1ZXI8_9BACT|nr:Carbohydrate family 9 binding domain-like [Thermophagus xiamenensis]